MNHNQQQIPQQGQQGGQNSAMNPSIAAASQQQQHGMMQVPPQHLMGLMSNPGLAAASSSLFPPSAMISNPGAFMAMQPEAFGVAAMATTNNNHASNAHQQQQSSHNNHNSMGIVHHQQTSNTTPIAPMGSHFASASATSSSNHAQQQGQQQHQQQQMNFPPVAPSNPKMLSSHLSSNSLDNTYNSKGKGSSSASQRQPRTDLTAEERAKQNRDRNREHARSTRLRKKAYVQKLKELVEGLHAERTEEVRQRRVAIQHLAEIQNVRRSVVRSFLRMHSRYETDEKKWLTILEDNFWLKQPVTPYRSFRRAEIEKECRISKGTESMICDSASLSVMIEGIGSKCARWMQLKREEFMYLEEANRGTKQMPRCIQRQESRLQHAISSLSSSSDSSNNTNRNKEQKTTARKSKKAKAAPQPHEQVPISASKTDPNEPMNKVSSSSGSGSGSGSGSDRSSGEKQDASKDFHDYHAKPLPDPKLGDSERSSDISPSDESPEESNGSSNGDGKRPISTDSSSGDDSAGAVEPPAAKKRKAESSKEATLSEEALAKKVAANMPSNIAKKGGIIHNVRPAEPDGNGAVRLQVAPAIVLPPFAGIGKRQMPAATLSTTNISDAANVAAETGDKKTSGAQNKLKNAVVIAADLETSCNEDMNKMPQIRGCYHINEDDMILMEDVLMCPFIFRSQDAVLCGAFAECVMPGMLRAHFSTRNKLSSLELVYDAMGFMQQLERASGNEGTAQIVSGSLEMALAPTPNEARVITLAKPPFLIVNVNDVWTRTTGYTQMEVEGKEYLALLEGEGTVQEAKIRPGKPPHLLEEVAKGRPACSTNIHYDSDGCDFIEFVCSFPLTNSNNDITHILHVSKELPSFEETLLKHQAM